jgi:hypothetical protein
VKLDLPDLASAQIGFGTIYSHLPVDARKIEPAKDVRAESGYTHNTCEYLENSR